MAHSAITRQTRETGQNKQTQMGTKKRIGVKYCGGCNPLYERVEMIERVQSQIKNQFLFLNDDESQIEAMVFISGCHRTCASQDVNSTGIPHWSVTGEKDYWNLMDWLTSLNERGDG